jgi:NitT/TauT family transport system substrate-binding protein
MRKPIARSLMLLALGLFATQADAQNDKVRISFNPQIYSYLPLMLAIDKGFFTEQKIDVEMSAYGGSALSQIPMLARGDQDIAGMVTGPGFFNQHAEGFGIKLISTVAQSKPGWHDTIWLIVRKELWDSGAIKTFADFKGRQMEGGPKGSPIYLNTLQVINQGGMTVKDVTFTERVRNLSDALPAFRNNAIDGMSMVEPVITGLIKEGVAVRWKPANETMPWFQEAYLAANPKFLVEKRDVSRRFLLAYFKAVDVIQAGNGKWSPETIAAVAKWSKLPEATINGIPGPQQPPADGAIDLASIEKQQKIWTDEGMVKIKTPIAELVDTSLLDEVQKEIRKK